MGFFARLLGRCQTSLPVDSSSWKVEQNYLVIEKGNTEELSKVKGAVRYEGEALPIRVLVMRGDDGNLHAFENKCAHGGRRIDPGPDENTLMCCSVSKATYDYQGTGLNEPAKGGIRVLELNEDEKKIRIKLN